MEFEFKNQENFETWLKENLDHEGIWIIFDKKRLTSSLTPEEALDIALCYGWIDGLIKRLDDQFYKKYFAKRLPKSIWSTKNKISVARLIKSGQMKKEGLDAINIAKSNGRWDQSDQNPVDFSVEDFILLIKDDEHAYAFYKTLSHSIQKTYALYYYTAKKEETRLRRLVDIKQRLRNHLKPME